MRNAFKNISIKHKKGLEVVSSGIEPESRASETLILSIVLRDQGLMWKCDDVANVEMSQHISVHY